MKVNKSLFPSIALYFDEKNCDSLQEAIILCINPIKRCTIKHLIRAVHSSR